MNLATVRPGDQLWYFGIAWPYAVERGTVSEKGALLPDDGGPPMDLKSDRVFRLQSEAARAACSFVEMIAAAYHLHGDRADAVVPGLRAQFESDDATFDPGAADVPDTIEPTVPGYAHGLTPQRGPKVGGVVMPDWPGSHHAEIWHFAVRRGVAACGADDPNMGLTDDKAHATCDVCLSRIGGVWPIGADPDALAFSHGHAGQYDDEFRPRLEPAGVSVRGAAQHGFRGDPE